jgi:hypothetical protein
MDKITVNNITFYRLSSMYRANSVHQQATIRSILGEKFYVEIEDFNKQEKTFALFEDKDKAFEYAALCLNRK